VRGWWGCPTTSVITELKFSLVALSPVARGSIVSTDMFRYGRLLQRFPVPDEATSHTQKGNFLALN
jgi:hypothetical protein